MSNWSTSHPEGAERISRLPIPQQNQAERAAQEKWTRREEIEATFTHWTKDPIRLARLWRWLGLAGVQPRDPAFYMEHPEEFAEQYEQMCSLEDFAS